MPPPLRVLQSLLGRIKAEPVTLTKTAVTVASGSRNLNSKNVIDFAVSQWLKTNSLDLGTGAPAIQVVTVVIPDAYDGAIRVRLFLVIQVVSSFRCL